MLEQHYNVSHGNKKGECELQKGMMNQTGIDDTNRQRVSGTSGNNGIQMVEKGPSASCRQVQ